jgi:prolyl oligopeptidase
MTIKYMIFRDFYFVLKPIFFMAVLLGLTACGQEEKMKEPIKYPETKKDFVVDVYHGDSIADPYRWLEDDRSEETQDWVQRQNEVTFPYLKSLPLRDSFKSRLTTLWNYERYGTPRKEGEHTYYFKNDGLQNQSVLYRVEEDGPDKMILDPNTFSEDGTSSLGSISFSKDGKRMAFQISEGGSDWRKVKVMDMETLNLMDDELDWIKFSGMSWYRDGFFYSRYPAENTDGELTAKNEYHSLYYHKLGTSQEEDKLIYKDQEHPMRNVYASVDDSKQFLIMSIIESTSGNALKIADLSNGIEGIEPVTIVDNFENDYTYIATARDKLVFTTNSEAPMQRVVALSAGDISAGWTEVLPQSENPLRWLSRAGEHFVAGYLKDASSQVEVFDLNFDPEYTLELPALGTVAAFRGNEDDEEAYFAFTSYTYPTTIYKVDLSKGDIEVFKAPEIDMDLSQFETVQDWFKSKDGTMVPMFITRKKDLVGKAGPTLLYGYGGFDVAVEPGFSISVLSFLEAGGTYAVANIRGGGEFGKDWHEAGILNKKQNVFDDFISAAEHLVAKGFTTSEMLGIEGGSNGGLLVGACMTQRPELFQVAFPRVGVLDMLRYHEFTIGWAWATDYGRSDDPEAYQYLIRYSPIHNVKDAEYPATLIMTADHDDRVVPAHSFKFAATLQDHQQGANPVLIRIETSAGHGAGKPTSKRIEEEADKWAFFFANINQ